MRYIQQSQLSLFCVSPFQLSLSKTTMAKPEIINILPNSAMGLRFQWYRSKLKEQPTIIDIEMKRVSTPVFRVRVRLTTNNTCPIPAGRAENTTMPRQISQLLVSTSTRQQLMAAKKKSRRARWKFISELSFIFTVFTITVEQAQTKFAIIRKKAKKRISARSVDRQFSKVDPDEKPQSKIRQIEAALTVMSMPVSPMMIPKSCFLLMVILYRQQSHMNTNIGPDESIVWITEIERQQWQVTIAQIYMTTERFLSKNQKK